MLYIVGTSIGNIEDTSLRAVKTLTESDVILAEDTATFDSYYNRIQNLFGILSQKKQQFIHFHKENEFEKTSHVIELLEQGLIVSLVSESGLPLISDPGYVLVKYLTSTNTKFTVIPGPTAFTTAALLSGFKTDKLLFLGFLPKKTGDIKKLFTNLEKTAKDYKGITVCFYESPHRIESTLTLLKELLPDAEIAICREMTKKFEEVIRIKSENINEQNVKGEITVVIKLN